MTVREISEVEYVVEAKSAEEAEEMFNKWVEDHQALVYDDLADNSYGWEYSYGGLARDQSCCADVAKNEIGEWI